MNTPGVVYYRLGQYQPAIATLERSLREGKGEAAAFDLFFLAMSYHQLDKPADAQKAYQEAIEWQLQAKMRPDEIEELNAFRAEAKALLKKTTGP
jgi:tetratricopeptide (TPR) repeat protein